MEIKLNKHSGACGCGLIEYILNSEIKNIVNCHCNMCRHHNGASFSTYVVLPIKALEVRNGKELISEYKVGTGNKRFCSNCGTPLFNTNEKYPGACMIYLGTLNTVTDLLPKVNVWCESKLGWVDAISDIQSVSQGV